MWSLLLSFLLNHFAQVLVDLSEHLISPLPHGLLSSAQVASNIVDEVLLLARCSPQYLPQLGWLDEIFLRDGQLLGYCRAGPFLVFLRGLDGLVGHVAVGGWVIGVGAVVAVDGHYAVTLVWVESAEGLVDGDLLVVHTEAVTVGIWVGKETGLQDGIGRWFNAGDHVTGGESDLLDFGEVVLRVSVEGEFAKGSQGNFSLWPNLG